MVVIGLSRDGFSSHHHGNSFFLLSLLRRMEGVGTYQSVNKDRNDGY